MPYLLVFASDAPVKEGLSGDLGRPCRLSKEEDEIAEVCIIFSEWGGGGGGMYGLGEKDIISVVADYLKSQKEHLFKNGIPGDDWWYKFMKLHPEISIRKPQALQLCRAKASRPLIFLTSWSLY